MISAVQSRAVGSLGWGGRVRRLIASRRTGLSLPVAGGRGKGEGGGGGQPHSRAKLKRWLLRGCGGGHREAMCVKELVAARLHSLPYAGDQDSPLLQPDIGCIRCAARPGGCVAALCGAQAREQCHVF